MQCALLLVLPLVLEEGSVSCWLLPCGGWRGFCPVFCGMYVVWCVCVGCTCVGVFACIALGVSVCVGIVARTSVGHERASVR